MFDGPSNMRELAVNLGLEVEYIYFYQYWSRIMHANDLSRYFVRLQKGDMGFNRIRSPDGIVQAAKLSTVYLLGVIRLMLKKFSSSEDLFISQWYQRKIRERFMKL